MNSIFTKIKSLLKPFLQDKSLAVVTLLVVVAGLWAYRNFSQTQKDLSGELKIEQSGNSGSISGGATTPDDLGLVAGAQSEKISGTVSTRTEKWRPRFIAAQTIKDSKYVVQKGDTLWEIAQGKYGSGFEWQKILEANKDKIGFLVDGSQARIEIGQELELP